MPAVLFVDDDADLREIMAESLAFLGFECVLASSLADVQRLGPTALGCEVAILDLNLGTDQQTGIEVVSWLRRQGYAGRIMFLTGHGSDDPRVKAAASMEDVPLLTKPLSLEAIKVLLNPPKEQP